MRFLIPVEDDESWGVNVCFGEEILVTWEGNEYECHCLGFRRPQPDYHTEIKTDLIQFFPRTFFPIENVQISITPREARLRGMYPVTA